MRFMRFCCWILMPLFAGENPGLPLFKQGRVQVQIAVAANASSQTQNASATLSDYLQKMSGSPVKTIRITPGEPQRSGPLIWVGAEALPQVKLPLDLETGFVIQNLNEEQLLIAGNNDWGTEFGVYAFLEDQLGVRWLYPGPDGERIPHPEQLVLPWLNRVERPVYLERMLSGFYGSHAQLWLRRQRAYFETAIQHNMNGLFPPETTALAHPEFYGFRKEQMARLIPANSSIYNWQPCLTAPGIADLAAQRVDAYFAAHPQKNAYSLVLNDSERFCEEDGCAQWQRGFNPMGFPNYSELYFAWVNQVAAKLSPAYSKKWLGALAYRETAEPPSFPLAKNVWVYMTQERLQWLESETKARGIQRTKDFVAKAERVGWYDYIYGSPYLLPRVAFKQQAEVLALGARLGVKGYYAEAYPNWLEGPKYYLAMKLMWEPGLDAEKLLQEWCELAVGAKAAVPLRAFYAHWEQIWTQKMVHLDWFKDSNTYLYFGDPIYLTAVEPREMAEAKKLLRRVAKQAKRPEEKVFAGQLVKLFAYSEVSYKSYRCCFDQQGRPKSEHCQNLYGKKRARFLRSFESEPLLKQPVNPFLEPERLSSLLWDSAVEERDTN